MIAGSLLLIDPDAASAAFVQRLLTEDGYEVSLAPSGKEGLISAWRDRPDLILIELDLPDIDGVELVERLRKDPRTERTRLIALTHRHLPEEAVRALGAGLDYYILKQPDAVGTLRRHLAETRREPEPPKESGPGHLVCFMSAKGGVGTSSLCLNLASSLGRRARGRSIVAVDLVRPFGSLGLISGAEANPDLVDIVEMEAADLSGEVLFARLPLLPGWGLRVLPGALDPGRAAAFVPERFPSLLQTLRTGFEFVFMDLGSRLSAVEFLAVQQAELVVIVLTGDSLAAGPTQRLLAHCESEGIPAAHLFLLANRPLGLEDLTGPSLERILGGPLDAAIPHLGRTIQLANNLHAPIHLRFPDEGATQTLDEIAQALEARLAVHARR
jgi:CheY-like chemotaxis protein